MNLTHIMVDLETFGRPPNAAVVSIGACVFDPVVGFVPKSTDLELVFHQKVDFEETPSDVLGEIDPSTVAWWLRQSEEARDALLTGDRLPLPEALGRFTAWLHTRFDPAQLSRYDTDVRLWSRGPSFDETILENAYRRCGAEWPFAFTVGRCCRTSEEVARRARMAKVGKSDLRHDALADAVFQAECVCAMYRHIGINEGGVLTLEGPPAEVEAK